MVVRFLRKTDKRKLRMSNFKKGGEAGRLFVEHMRSNLSQKFCPLWQEVALLHVRWAEYKELFGTGRERVLLLNATAPRFFRGIQKVLWEGIVLQIARLTEPTESGDNRGLTIGVLPGLVENGGVAESLAELVLVAMQESGYCRAWRNKRMMHMETGHGSDGRVRQLRGDRRLGVERALRSISAVLMAFARHRGCAGATFESEGDTAGVGALLEVLEDGLRAKREQKAQARRERKLAHRREWKRAAEARRHGG